MEQIFFTSFFWYVFVLCCAAVAGLIYISRNEDKASVILVLILILTICSEIMAHKFAGWFQNNMIVYHTFGPLQLLLTGLYFDKSMPSGREKRLGLKAGLSGLIVALLNAWLLQPTNVLPSNFLLYDGLVVMGLCLYAFQQILIDDKIDIYRYTHFWIYVLLLFFWSCTYLVWALYTYISVKNIYLMPSLHWAIWSVNVITYAGLGVVFLLFSKRSAYER